MSERTEQLRIRTPEGVTFGLPLAGPVSRALAWGVDAIVVIGTTLFLSKFVALLNLIDGDFATGAAILFFFALSIGYRICMEWFWRGQTLGKRILKLRVVDEQGLRLRFSQIAIRNLLRPIDVLPVAYLVGGAACFFSERAQRLGDFAASTVVIRQPHFSEPDARQILGGKFNSLRAHAHLAARLRHKTPPAIAGLALTALQRRDGYDPAARVELFADLAADLKARVEFPIETVEGLSDEQYVRNCVDILFNS